MARVTDSSETVRRAKGLDTFAGRMTKSIGVQIKRWRRLQKLTTQELSDATDTLGHRVPRSVIINLENDRRDYVSVVEVLLLAAALNVPPVLLIAPVGTAETEEILPGVQRSPWRSRGWLMGAVPVEHACMDGPKWNTATLAIKMYDKHRLLVRSYEQANLRLQELDGDRMDIYTAEQQWPQAELVQRQKIRGLMLRQLASYLEQIRAQRQEIEQHGLAMPALPPEVEADLSAPAGAFGPDPGMA